MIPTAPSKAATPRSRLGSRGHRPGYRGRRHGCGPPHKQGWKCRGMNIGSDSSVSSDWMYTGPEIEAQVVPDGPPHPSQQRDQPDMDHPAVGDATTGGEQEGHEGGCIPYSILAETNLNKRKAPTYTAELPEWGAFGSVVLPAKVSCTRFKFHEKPSCQKGGDHGGEGRKIRFDILKSLEKRTVGGSRRSRDRALRLSTAMQSLLRGVRSNSRPGRVKLVTAGAALDKDEMLFLSSGARMGLDLVSAVEDVVTEEREVFEECFRILIQQERIVCRERGDLIDVMRGHYASLLEEVVERLSQLRASLEDTLDEEERLKHQAHSVKRLAKILVEDAKVDDEYHRKLDAMPQTELELFMASRHPSATSTEEPSRDSTPGVTSMNTSVDEEDVTEKNSRQTPTPREPLLDAWAEERANPGNDSVENGTRHMMASMRMEGLSEMIGEKMAANREQDRRKKRRMYNAATTIKNWWRRLKPPHWETHDRWCAATLIQAHARGKISRLMRKRAVQDFKVSKSLLVLARWLRQYLAVKERKKRAKIVHVALAASIRSLDKAIDNLETKASSLYAEQQENMTVFLTQEERCQSRGHQDSVNESTSDKTGGDGNYDAPSQHASPGACGHSVVGENPKKEETMASLIARLNAVGRVLDKCKGKHGGAGWREMSMSDARHRISYMGVTSCSSGGEGGRKGTLIKRRQS